VSDGEKYPYPSAIGRQKDTLGFIGIAYLQARQIGLGRYMYMYIGLLPDGEVQRLT